jgi:crossover junction endodeoxyribonuclease RuvC
MNVVGIDPSLTSTGVIILNDAGEFVAQKNIKPKKLRGMPRLKFIKEELASFLKEHKVEKAAIESYAFNIKKSRMKFQLGELGGVVRLLLFEMGIDYLDVAIPTLKKYVTGSGDADKVMIIYSVNNRWGIDFGSNSDLADAYGLAKVAFDQYTLLIDLKDTIKEMKKTKVKYYLGMMELYENQDISSERGPEDEYLNPEEDDQDLGDIE